MESYYQAKRKLFAEVLREGGKRTAVVLNADDAHGRRLAEDSGVDSERWLYTLGDAPVRARVSVTSLEQSLEGTRLELNTPAGPMTVSSPLIGRFNVSNLLAAISTGLASGIAVPVIERGLSGMTGVPGRLERVPNSRGVHAFVDYAHTPDAIDRVAGTLAELRIGRLITVFGCGGDRDRTKRPLMAEAAVRHSSQVILTSDNPRSEHPEAILDEAEAGLRKSGWQKTAGEVLADREYLRVSDRAQAIVAAVRMSLPGDTILVAGKGHEDYQIIGQEKRHFDDRKELAKAFKDSGR
jgi:UDP-N-acetylmuramoyl-L-alanyl-D-glutamate--2,6-diaminopimelate ligase